MIPFMHGQDYAGQDIAGWIATEKLDGCRAWWDGTALWSRSGKPVKAPPAMLAELPAGIELYAGPGTRYAVAAAMRNGLWPPRSRFVAFDAPSITGGFECRHAALCSIWAGWNTVEIIAAAKISDAETARHMLRVITQAGGEGLMLHRPGTPYAPGRVPHMLKLKEWLL